MKKIAIINQKGGVAKTTSAINIAIGLGKKGKKVLLMDLDAQANTTTGLGIDKLELEYTVYDLLKREDYPQYKDLKIEDVIIKKFNIDILPTNIKMSRIESELGGFPGKENYVKDLLKEEDGYDYVIFDCPPSLSMITHNALVAADEVYVPVKTDYYSIEGIADLLNEIEMIKRKLNFKLKIGGVFMTMVNKKTLLYSETKEKLEKYFSKELFQTSIRVNEEINKAVGKGKSVLDYNPKCNGSIDYMNLIDEIILREVK